MIAFVALPEVTELEAILKSRESEDLVHSCLVKTKGCGLLGEVCH